MITIVLEGHEYSTASKLDAFAQLAIARKLTPALPIIEGLVRPENAGKDKSILSVIMLSRLTDEDTDYIIRKCLTTVFRKQADGKSARIQSQDGNLMFDDVSMNTLLELTVAIIEDNLGDFFRTALAVLPPHQENPQP